MQMEYGIIIIIIIIRNMDSLSIMQFAAYFKIITQMAARPIFSMQKKICWRLKEQLNFVAGVLNYAVFFLQKIEKKKKTNL